MPHDIKTRFRQLEPVESTIGIEVVEVDNQIVFRETIGRARSGRRALRFIVSVFCVFFPFLLYLGRSDYGFAWLVAAGIAVYTLYKLFQDKPLEQTQYLAIDTDRNELIISRPKPLAVSHYQRVDIDRIKHFMIEKPDHSDDDGHLCAWLGQQSVEILHGTYLGDNRIAQMGKWLAFLCDKPFNGRA